MGFEYESGTPVLHDISLRVEPGQAIALLGSTGSGKTTLVNLLPRFYEYTHGSLQLDGVELKEYPQRLPARRDRHCRAGAVPLLALPAGEHHLRRGSRRFRRRGGSRRRAAAIHDVILTFPEGYKTLVGEKGVTLSGGQRQRVAIARTLLKDPRILILDDSTSSVDTETEAEIRTALERLMQGRTTFIIAHRIQSLMNADLILVLDKGRIIQHGTHDELMAQEGMYRQIYDLQAKIEDELQVELAGV